VPVLDPALGFVIVLGSALLLASAALQKFRGLARFSDIVTAHRVLPEALSRPVACLVPCVETAIALALVWQPMRNGAVLAAMVLLIVYAGSLGINLLRGRRDLDCGCGAARDRRPIAAWMVWRNVLLAAAVGVTALPWSPRSLDSTDLLTIIGSLTVVIILYAAADRLLGDVMPRAFVLRSRS
jgi:Methylamine utilisation protein MauE